MTESLCYVQTLNTHRGQSRVASKWVMLHSRIWVETSSRSITGTPRGASLSRLSPTPKWTLQASSCVVRGATQRLSSLPPRLNGRTAGGQPLRIERSQIQQVGLLVVIPDDIKWNLRTI